MVRGADESGTVGRSVAGACGPGRLFKIPIVFARPIPKAELQLFSNLLYFICH